MKEVHEMTEQELSLSYYRRVPFYEFLVEELSKETKIYDYNQMAAYVFEKLKGI